MSRIERLRSGVIDQIAAGEVIERPASVAKELLENALDAGASRIRVETEAAGLSLIRVLDDGAGIAADDLALALERHATSKIRDASDLHQIHTLGFRGEALPSIASVSRLRLVSRAAGAEEGAEVRVQGGRREDVRPHAHPPGTLVEVRDLFFNTPARRKFLRSAPAESRALSLRISQLAVAHSQVRFDHFHDGRPLLESPRATSLRERVAQVHGAQAAEHMLDVEGEGPGGISVRGLVSDAAGSRGNRSGQWLYVNGRLIQDRPLTHAIHEAASDYIPKGRHATAFLFIEVPPEAVDANVHPAKWTVRFSHPDRVRSLIYRAVREAAQRALAFSPAPTPVQGSTEAPERATPEALSHSDLAEPKPPSWLAGGDPRERPRSGFGPAEAGREPVPAPEAAARPLPLGGEAPATLVPLAQYRNSFIVATDGRDLLIVDQHVAHERILYERVLRQWAEGKAERQPLLLPRPVSLSPEEMVTFEEVRGELEQAGFRIEPFGPREVVLREAPAMAGSEDVEGLVRGLLEEGLEARQGRALASLRERLAARCACHAAIKVHTPLSIEKMEFLLRELLKTRTPFLCPHGRPIVLRLSDRALERAFGRC
jgi:DNA mismatch repair protein MutL